MCLPVAVAGALLAGGAGLSYLGNRQAQKAQMRTFRAEQARQQAMDAEQQGLFAGSLDKMKALQGGGEDAAVANRKEAFIQALEAGRPRQDALPGMDRAPAQVGAAANKVIGAQHVASENTADAMARMGGMGDALFKANIGIGRDAQQIGQIGKNRANSAGILDAELAAAAQKGAFLRGLGALAMQIGASAAMGGIGGGAGSGFGGATAANAGVSMPASVLGTGQIPISASIPVPF